jgi:hypothetical protein
VASRPWIVRREVEGWSAVSFFRKSRRAAQPTVQAAPGQRKGPPTDDLMGDPDAYRFLADLAEGRWQEFHDFVDITRDWDDRNFYVTELAKIAGRPDWLDEWVAGRPDSPLPLLFRGTHSTHWAWQARGVGRGSTVAEDAWAIFHARLVDADRDLARAAAMDAEDPTPHARSLWTAIGLELGQPELRRRFGEVARRHRWHLFAHTSMIQGLAAKWAGSNQLMFEFARSASAQAPDGHGVHRVIPLAHLEQWLNLPRESADGKDRQSRYFQAEPVKDEIRRAADRSIRSPGYVAGKATPLDRNIFAMCFWLMHDYEAQLEQMRLIGPLIQASPWHYQGDPGWAYERARTTAMERVMPRGPGAA